MKITSLIMGCILALIFSVGFVQAETTVSKNLTTDSQPKIIIGYSYTEIRPLPYTYWNWGWWNYYNPTPYGYNYPSYYGYYGGGWSSPFFGWR